MVPIARACIGLLAASVSGADATAISFRGSAQAHESDVIRILGKDLAEHGQRLEKIEEELRPMFTSLPQDAHGRVSHELVRYTLHRFFLQRHGWFIRGLEPGNRQWTPFPLPNGSMPFFVKEWVPSFIQDRIEHNDRGRGMELHEMAAMVATMEDLINEEVSSRMKLVYEVHDYSPKSSLNAEGAGEVLGTYFISYLLGNNFTVRSKQHLNRKKTLFAQKYRGYQAVEKWYNEVVGQDFTDKEDWDFASMATTANLIGERYHDFNENECSDLRSTLKSLESRKAGRVRLSTFYNMSRVSHWRFIEKVEYLQALGALDMSNPEQPSVIIANYVMSRPNCLDASNLYAVCCRNACEDLMQNLEQSIGSPSAPAAKIVELVSAMPSQFVQAPRPLPEAMVSRLESVAAQNDGQVPLHGRLFAQWMHHAFPMECPYPQEASTVNPQTYEEWVSGGASGSSSEEEMTRQIESDACAVGWEGKPECEQESAELPWTWSSDDVVESAAAMLNAEVFVEPVVLADFRSGSLIFLAVAMALLAAMALARLQGHPALHQAVLTLRAHKWVLVAFVLTLGVIAQLLGVLDGSARRFIAMGCCVLYVCNLVAMRGQKGKGIDDQGLPMFAKTV